MNHLQAITLWSVVRGCLCMNKQAFAFRLTDPSVNYLDEERVEWQPSSSSAHEASEKSRREACKNIGDFLIRWGMALKAVE